MITAVRGAVSLTGVGRVVADRRVMVSLSLPGFSLHDTHIPPINEANSYTPYGALACVTGICSNIVKCVLEGTSRFSFAEV